MDQAQLKEAIGRPQMLRLKQIGVGIKVGKVLGSRVLVKTVIPWTEADEVEKKGLLYIPEAVKKDNTPMPTTGIVILTGPNLPCDFCGGASHGNGGYGVLDVAHDYVPVLQEGDMIMFPKFSGSDFKIENEDFRIIEAAEIICTLVDTQQALTEVAAEGA